MSIPPYLIEMTQSSTRGPCQDDSEIAVVVLNYNGLEDTLECLASLRSSEQSVHTIVVDNASQRGEIEHLRTSGMAATVLAAGTNLGYAGGNNLGLRHALVRGSSVIIVLNNDTTVDAKAIGRMAAHLRCGRHYAISPHVRYHEETDKTWFAGGVIDGRGPRHLQTDELPPPSLGVRPTVWLSGCCIAATAETWATVGMFNPDYFLLFEDCEWSARAAALGVQLGIADDSVITHKVSRSFDTASRVSIASFYFSRNGLRYVARHQRRLLWRCTWAWLIQPLARRRSNRRDILLRWAGAACFVAGQKGPAPAAVTSLCARLA